MSKSDLYKKVSLFITFIPTWFLGLSFLIPLIFLFLQANLRIDNNDLSSYYSIFNFSLENDYLLNVFNCYSLISPNFINLSLFNSILSIVSKLLIIENSNLNNLVSLYFSYQFLFFGIGILFNLVVSLFSLLFNWISNIGG